MPQLTRPDGAEIHWEGAGEGPVVVISPAVFGNRDQFGEFAAELSHDHTIVRYDPRGTGDSSRVGPHDLDTGAADLEAVIEAAGAPAVVVAFGDACNRAVRVGARRPDLISAVLAGGGPMGRRSMAGLDAMAASDAVVDTFLEMIDSYYASALRQIVSDANPQMSEEEVRERVEQQVAYCPQEVAAQRLRAWTDDDALEEGASMGERLIMISWPGGGRPWFPEQDDLARLARELLPEARLEMLDDGLVSRPDLGAAVVRGVTEELRVPAVEQ